MKRELLKGKDIVCFSSRDFQEHDTPTEVRYVMRILSRDNRVLYVENIGNRSVKLLRFDLERIGNRIHNWAKGIKRMEESNLFIASPILIPFSGIRTVDRVNQRLLAGTIKKFLKQLDFKSPILWFYTPSPAGIIDRLDSSLILYSIVDDWSLLLGPENKALIEKDRMLLERADVLLFSSKELLQKKSRPGQKAYHIPHGVDFDHFSKSFTVSLAVPEDIKSIPRPIAGVVGSVDTWYDFDLLEYVVEHNPRLSIVIVGPVLNVDISRYRGHPNIYFLGQKPYEVLPNYYKYFDVCLIPFRVEKHIWYCSPTRLFEYFATGRPVVATDFPATNTFRDIIGVAGTREEFLRHVNASLEGEDTSRNARIETARNNSWTSMVENLSGIIEDAIAEKSKGKPRQDSCTRVSIDT